MTRVLRDIPADLREVIASGMTRECMIEHYKCGWATLRRWMDELGEGPAPRPSMPMPKDLAQLAQKMSKNMLAAKLGVSRRTITRWLGSLGLTARDNYTPAHFSLVPTGGRGTNFTHTKASSIYDLAADEIRRQRFAVHRCDERGLYRESGKFWRVGQIVVTPEELLERAERYRAREMAA